MAGGPAEDNPVGINVTAMVDIIFCLCLFFMCSLKFKELEGKMDSWLPKDKGGKPSAEMNVSVDEIRVVLSWNESTNALERLFVSRPIPMGKAGDRELQELIRQQHETYVKLGKPDAPVIIDAGPKVPWQAIIDVMNICRYERIEKIEFAFGSVDKPKQ